MWQPTTFEQVFRASIEAIGGAAAIDNIASISATAHCTSPRGGYITEIQSMRGDRLMFTQLWPEHPPLVAYKIKPIDRRCAFGKGDHYAKLGR